MVVPSLSLDHFRHITLMLVMVLAMDPANNTELMLVATIMGLTLAGVFTIPRRCSFFDKRLDFAAFFETHKHRADFKVHIRMAPASFMKLLGFI